MFSRRPQFLPLAVQYMLLQKSTHGGAGRVHNGMLVWEFNAQPSPLSRTYKLRIAYTNAGAPAVYVLEPDLTVLAGDKRLPHVYRHYSPVELCLYRPGKREWARNMKITETIIPWAILWLLYFEEWLISNEWKGGGEHPAEKNDKHEKKNTRH